MRHPVCSRSLPETADEKVAALLEEGCPQSAIDSCLKNYLMPPTPVAVASWYDSGLRLTKAFVPAAPMPELAPVTSRSEESLVGMMRSFSVQGQSFYD